MRQMRIRHLVVQEGRRIVGVVSDLDLENLGSMGEVEKVEDVMSSPAVTASPETTLRQAANLLRGRSIGCLPVVEKDRLIGIVTTTDLLDLIGRGAERPIPKTRRWVLKDRGPRGKPVVGRGRTLSPGPGR
jgi:acetoin utilization protein AcuB